MNPAQSFRSWRAHRSKKKMQRRHDDLNKRILESDNQTVAELRVVIMKRDHTARRLREEIDRLGKKIIEDSEAFEHRLESAKRGLELAKEENRLLAMIHESDIARREAEAAVFLRKASNPADFSPPQGEPII